MACRCMERYTSARRLDCSVFVLNHVLLGFISKHIRRTVHLSLVGRFFFLMCGCISYSYMYEQSVFMYACTVVDFDP